MLDPVYALCGFVVGMPIGMNGVGGGSLMTPPLILLFGVHPETAVGTDLIYAAAVGHWVVGSVDWSIIASLLVGSLPGVFLGSGFALGVPERALRPLLAATLAVVASHIAYDQTSTAHAMFTAFTRRAVP